MTTQRYKLTVSYRGAAYHGWQFQYAAATWKGPKPAPGRGIPTIQETLKRAIIHVVRHPVTLVGASRTDSGVHAKGQVAHFDTHMTQIPTDGMRRGINSELPDDIVVRSIVPVPRSFDAIASTFSKRYQYVIWNADDKPAFFPELVWHRWQPLDVPAMKEAAKYIVGTHDFTSFARPGHGRETTVRTILECDVAQRGPRIVIGIHGTGFLWNMVRIIVGTLTDVGMGRFKPEEIPGMFEARDRRRSGSTAPAEGLYLQWVNYGDPAGSPDMATSYDE